MRWFPNEGRYWAGKLQTGINLLPLMPDEDKTFRGFLVLDLRIDVTCTHSIGFFFVNFVNISRILFIIVL